MIPSTLRTLPSWRRRVALAPLLLLALVGGCDRCLTSASCGGSPYLAAAGQVVDLSTGVGIDGVQVRMVRTGGIAVTSDSVSAVTSDGGFWRVEFSPADSGSITARVQVEAPGERPYTLNAVSLTTRRNRGDANLNQRWVPVLYFPHQLELFEEGTADTRVWEARVEFRRTDGAELYGPGIAGPFVLLTTDKGGRSPLFPTSGDNAVFAADDRTLVGTLTIRAVGVTTVIPNVRLAPSHIYQEPAGIYRYPVGGAAAGPDTR